MIQQHVLHIIDSSRTGGGAEANLYYLSRELGSRYKFSVCVLGTVGANSDLYRSMGAKVYELGVRFPGKWNPLAIFQIRKIVENEQVDLIHTWLFKSHILGGIVGRITGTKTIINDRSIILPDNLKTNLKHYFNKKFAVQAYLYLYERVIRNCAKIVVFTPFLKDLYIQCYGISDHRLAVLPNGIYLKETGSGLLKQPPLNFRASIGVDDKTKLIVMVARLVEEKDWHTFLNIAKVIGDTKSYDCKFLVVGQGSLENTLKQYVLEHKLRNVEFLGYCEDVISILKECDVFLLTSKNEPFGMVILEAMAAGLPVIAARSPGPVSILTDGLDGYLVDVGDVQNFVKKILGLFENESYRRSMIIGAYATINERYRIEIVAQLLADIYENVLHELGGKQGVPG